MPPPLPLKSWDEWDFTWRTQLKWIWESKKLKQLQSQERQGRREQPKEPHRSTWRNCLRLGKEWTERIRGGRMVHSQRASKNGISIPRTGKHHTSQGPGESRQKCLAPQYWGIISSRLKNTMVLAQQVLKRQSEEIKVFSKIELHFQTKLKKTYRNIKICNTTEVKFINVIQSWIFIKIQIYQDV